MSAQWLLGFAVGWMLYALLLVGMHLLFTRQERRRVAAGAVFRRRMRKHVLKGFIWSSFAKASEDRS
ncbi:hypothetical protein EH240_19800 [Mesorhizobium tamadayense]|uniref:Uncharacterized protein n=1 Tax=Mesorhizobium tamadayense TaxID=425306 RepID=A0A3P3FHE3_9HYPH|nr:hypothetical protein [Mesorhizobium tamadayense]RRH98043.1 hypothetical protein EH240_19800 [Mesorhizobium tamadayense]